MQHTSPPYAAARLAESDDRYPAVAILNHRYRVIRCRDGIQWILQRRNVPTGTGGNLAERHSTDDWRGRSHCRTRDALIGCCDRFCGEIDPAAVAALATLPDRIEPPSGSPRKALDRRLARSELLPDPGRLDAFPSANRLLERADSHITFPDRQWHPIGTVNIKELADIVGPIPDFLRREVRA